MELNMNPELKAKWVAALRSGEFKQGEEALASKENDGSYTNCCIGVLGIVCGITQEELIGHDIFGRTGSESNKLLTNKVLSLGFPDQLIWKDGDQTKNQTMFTLTSYNDGVSSRANPQEIQLNFDQIADLIEQSN